MFNQTILPILLEQALLPIIGTIITAILGWGVALLKQWTGKEIEARHTQALQSALTNGVRYAISLLSQNGGRLDFRDPQIVARITTDAIEYVQGSVPDAIEHFKLTNPTLQRLLRPHLPVLTEDQARDLIEQQTGIRPTNEVFKR